MSELKFEKCQNPGSVIWENFSITKKQFRKNSAKVWTFVLLFELIAIITILIVKGLIQKFAYDYSFQSQCESIDNMFAGDTDSYQTYANIDKPFVK